MESILPITGALIGSSCCVIQLVLNAFSIGCAGFAVFDKWRPHGIAMMFGSIVYSLCRNVKSGTFWDTRSWNSIVVSIVIAVMPLLVNYTNNPKLSLAPQVEVFKVKVSGMKCMACANTAHIAINSIPGVVNNNVNFENSEIVIHAKPAMVTETIIQEVMNEKGFEVVVIKQE